MRLVFAIWYRRMSDRLKNRPFFGDPWQKVPGAPVVQLSRWVGEILFFSCRIRNVESSQIFWSANRKLDDSPLLRAFFWTLFLGCEEPTAVAGARTSRDTRAHRRRTNERGFGAVVSRSHRPGGSRIRRYRASPTRVDGPPRRLKASTPRNPSVSGCPSLPCPAGSSTTFQTRTTDPAIITNISRRPRTSRKGASGGWRRIPDASRGTARAKRRSGRATSRSV